VKKEKYSFGEISLSMNYGQDWTEFLSDLWERVREAKVFSVDRVSFIE
jgi:hypothetical protein